MLPQVMCAAVNESFALLLRSLENLSLSPFSFSLFSFMNPYSIVQQL